jgi:phosphatidate cytidylyltransferase
MARFHGAGFSENRGYFCQQGTSFWRDASIMTLPRWSDLPSRFYSALVLIVVGFWALFYGGLLLLLAVSILVSVMHFELAKMQSPLNAVAPKFSSLVGLMTLMILNYSSYWFLSIGVLAFSLSCQYFLFKIQKFAGVFYSVVIILGGVYFLELRADFGILFVGWVICVVIVTDTFGYFGGRLIGGPKFFVSISPNKTWAGIVSGWLGTIICTYFFMEQKVFIDFMFSPQTLFLFAIILSFCSQVGDIFESFIKRKCNVKDSSNIIPGHGGFMDRFDGIIVAILVSGILGPILI